MSERITGAEAICRALLAEGVDTIFGYPGGQIMPFYDKLYDFTDSLRHILTRHEQGAVHAAQGYARASGRVGVVTVTSGPAATNVITGLGDANIDCTPIVVITGQVGVASLGTDAFQETDVIGITQPITKWAYQIRRPEEIPWAMARAFYIATTGRPGAVVLDITRDAQVGTLDWRYKKTNYIRSYNPAPELQPGEIISAAALINRSERPLILSGHGVMLSEAETDLLALAEKADIPVATTLLGLSTIPSEHPLNKGMVGMRFDDRVTGVIKSYAPQAKIIHIDIDSAEFNKNVKAHIAIHADAKTALRALLPQINKADRKEWLTTFERPENVEQAEVIERETDPKDLGPESPMRMGEVVRKLSEATGNKAIVVTDVGQNQMMSARYSSYTMPKSMITSGGLGTMGFCLPAAIGAKLAEPSREVLAFMGDGGFQMTMQELGTILEYRIGVKMVLLNNNYLGNVRQWQAMFYNNRFSATPMVNPDFVAIAAAYGIPAENVSCRAELDSAIARMAAHDGAYLLNVNIDPTDMVFPMVTPGSAIDNILINATDKYEA